MQGKVRKILAVCTVILMASVIAVWTIPPFRVLPYALTLVFHPVPPRLPVPVEGVRASRLADTWGAARSGGRRHQGIDIFSRRGTPVHSATEGIVTDVGVNRLGGRCVWVLGPGGYLHYYAHLESYGEVKPGLRIREGYRIGTVGDSGNAKGTPPHLHYGIYRIIGGATNPYPLLKPQNNTTTEGGR